MDIILRTNRLLISIPLILSFLLTGCSKSLEGEAFYKNGDIAIKISDIDIRIIEKAKFEQKLEDAKKRIPIEVDKIKMQISSLENSNKTLKKSQEDVQRAQMNLLTLQAQSGVSWNINSLGGQYMQNQQDALLKQSATQSANTSEAIAKNTSEISSLQRKIDLLLSGKDGRFLFPTAVDLDLISTKTNSDGRFKIEYKSDKDLVLLAKHNERVWMLNLPSDVKVLNLTDRNEVSNGCDVCGVATATAPTTAAPAPMATAPAAITTPAPAPAAAALAAGSAKVAASGAGKKLYDTACMACHATGLAGSPKFGDKTAWTPRIATGMDALYTSVIKGKGAMPPKGGSAASEDEIKAAVQYMVAAAK
jgi:cytochrome c5